MRPWIRVVLRNTEGIQDSEEELVKIVLLLGVTTHPESPYDKELRLTKIPGTSDILNFVTETPLPCRREEVGTNQNRLLTPEDGDRPVHLAQTPVRLMFDDKAHLLPSRLCSGIEDLIKSCKKTVAILKSPGIRVCGFSARDAVVQGGGSFELFGSQK